MATAVAVEASAVFADSVNGKVVGETSRDDPGAAIAAGTDRRKSLRLQRESIAGDVT